MARKVNYHERLKAFNQFEGVYGYIQIHSQFREEISAKGLTPVECIKCGAGQAGDWYIRLDNWNLTNFQRKTREGNQNIGIGCPACKNISNVTEKFQAVFHNQYKLIGKTYACKKRKPDETSILYTILNKKGEAITANIGDRSKIEFTKREIELFIIRKYISHINKPKTENELKNEKKIDALTKEFCLIFPHGSIEYTRKRRTGHHSGLFFNFNTGIRIMRNERQENIASLRRVKEIIRQEQTDKEKHMLWSEEALAAGATIISYQEQDKGKIIICYKSRTNHFKEHTIIRARETFWGQSGFRRGEKTCLTILQLLFPEHTWKSNIRPNFLKNHTGFNLELDGYCETLKLAFEHQGNQHFQIKTGFNSDLDTIKQNDQLKKIRCKENGIKLLIINDRNLQVDLYIDDIFEQLLSFNIEITQSKLEVREKFFNCYNELNQNPLKPFQDKLIHKLGKHKLIAPEISMVAKDTEITYQCSSCMEENQIIAKSYQKNKGLCPKCKQIEIPKRRRLNEINNKLPKYIHKYLIIEPNKRLRLQCPINKEHIFTLDMYNKAFNFFENEEFQCPKCQKHINSA